jgi:hypothetical protein
MCIQREKLEKLMDEYFVEERGCLDQVERNFTTIARSTRC